MKKQRWQPLRQANRVKRLTDEDVRYAMERTGQDERTARTALEQEFGGIEYWVNDLYQVALRRLYDEDDKNFMVHLNIRRRDGKPIFRDWRHWQWIKNQLVGEECEGFELYPAESRLNDTSNKYHLWVYTDPNFRIPVGMMERDVIDDNGDRTRPGYRQRPL